MNLSEYWSISGSQSTSTASTSAMPLPAESLVKKLSRASFEVAAFFWATLMFGCGFSNSGMSSS